MDKKECIVGFELSLKRFLMVNDEETGLKVKIRGPVGKWSFFKNPNLLIKGITFTCTYLEGKVKLCAEHKHYFWTGIDKINQFKFSREILKNFRYS